MSKLPNITIQFAEWYQEALAQADLVDQSPTKGCFILRPYGYAIWENIRDVLDKKIKETGAQNAYFPLLIPESFLTKEQKHIEGFAPEVAVVTHAGGKKLEEPFVIRPTSETIMYDAFARWIKSWRDLPLKINQWANVVRWEMRTRPFLRTIEFLWQEGHTAHATYQEAQDTALQMLYNYRDLAHNYLAIPVTIGEKTASERFPGADITYTFEGLMQDGKALQMGTSHLLSQSFPASFGVSFQDKDGQVKAPYCTSWGATTRLIGAMIMMHGDENGIIVAPRIAPIQCVIIPIFKTPEEQAIVVAQAKNIEQLLIAQGIKALVDEDTQKTPGAKFFHWEAKGVPVRMELGPRDVNAEQVVLVNRIEQDKAKKKKTIALVDVILETKNMLDSIHNDLYARAEAKRASMWHKVDKLVDFGSQLQQKNGMYQAGWCSSAACEEQLKQYQGAVRCVLKDQVAKSCFACDKPSLADVLIAKCY